MGGTFLGEVPLKHEKLGSLGPKSDHKPQLSKTSQRNQVYKLNSWRRIEKHFGDLSHHAKRCWNYPFWNFGAKTCCITFPKNVYAWLGCGIYRVTLHNFPPNALLSNLILTPYFMTATSILFFLRHFIWLLMFFAFSKVSYGRHLPHFWIIDDWKTTGSSTALVWSGSFSKSNYYISIPFWNDLDWVGKGDTCISTISMQRYIWLSDC